MFLSINFVCQCLGKSFLDFGQREEEGFVHFWSDKSLKLIVHVIQCRRLYLAASSFGFLSHPKHFPTATVSLSLGTQEMFF